MRRLTSRRDMASRRTLDVSWEGVDPLKNGEDENEDSDVYPDEDPQQKKASPSKWWGVLQSFWETFCSFVFLQYLCVVIVSWEMEISWK